VEHFSRYGYIGGRVHCLHGCTSLWLLKRADGADVTPPTNRQRRLTRMICCDCHRSFDAKARNAMRCADCRREIHRLRAQRAQQLYMHKKRAHGG